MLPGYAYQNGRLTFDGQNLEELAERFGTPLYVYSENILRDRYHSYERGIHGRKALICFAAKSNSNLSVLRLLSSLGAGADIVSGGELYRCLKAGIDPGRIVFSGVGKSDGEIRAGLEAGILLFSIESAEELDRLAELASQSGMRPRISFRMNPDVDAKTHPYISTGLRQNKFGIPFHEFERMIDRALSLKNVELSGFGYHIGSQFTDVSGPEAAAVKAVELERIFRAKVGPPAFIDAGGGLGVRYRGEQPPEPDEYARRILAILDYPQSTILFEPGRSIAGPAGLLLTRVLFRKESDEKSFYICDAAMNDLVRPSLYQAYHEIYPSREIRREDLRRGDLVGPVCETGDFLARDRDLPHFEQRDVLAVATAGAYGFAMSSQYNSRPRPAEVMIRANGDVQTVRRRETPEDLIVAEMDL